jgi:hypothetical protein
MARSSNSLKFVSRALLAFVVFAGVALWKKRGEALRVVEPKDQELAATFHTHRQAFETTAGNGD